MKKLIAASMALCGMALAGNVTAGEYYMYSDFTSSTGFRSGYDVDSYENYIYVNSGNSIDRYTLSTATASGADANTHPDNIGLDGISGTSDDNQGPMLTRTLSFDLTYDVPSIGGESTSEIYATANRVYFFDDTDAVSYYQFSDGSTGTVTSSLGGATYDSWGGGSHLARTSDGTWYASGEYNTIFEYDGANWVKIADHILSPGGSHLDGLTAVSLDVTDDGTDNAEEWLFAADMTSNYMQRYALDGTWQEQYTYSDNGQALDVEGLGFGANNHFWATSGSHLYEIGGGIFTGTKDPVDDNPNPVPEPTTMLLFGAGMAGLIGARRRKSLKK